LVLAFAGASCRIRAGTAPYWQETHGESSFKSLAATQKGAIVLNREGNALYRYPGEWGRPWVEEARLVASIVAGSPTAIYVFDERGGIRRRASGSIRSYSGSNGWKVSALTASETDALYVVSEGRVRAVREDRLSEELCPGRDAKVIAASGDEVVWVVDEGGNLLRADRTTCTPVDAPAALTAVSAFGAALSVVNRRGMAFRRLDNGWQTLAPPIRYRPDQFPQQAKIVALAQSELWLWAMDEEGCIHFLSDPT
jgi:hypothetical protein